MGTGGGEGAAYAGFLLALLEQKVPIGGVCACGTSVFPCLVAAGDSDLGFAMRVWSQLEASDLLPDEEAVYGAMTTLLDGVRVESGPLNLAVVASDIHKREPLVLTTGEAATVAALSLWSRQGPCLVKVEQQDLSDGSAFGIPADIAMRLFGRPVVAVRASSHARTEASLAEILLAIASHKVNGHAEFTVDIEIEPGREHDAQAWFATGQRFGWDWGPKLRILAQNRNQ